MSDLFANLVGRAQGTSPQVRPLHPLYRGDGGAVAHEVSEEVATEPQRAALAVPPPVPELPHSRPERIAPHAPVDAMEPSEPVEVRPLAEPSRPIPRPTPPDSAPPPAPEVVIVRDSTTRKVPVRVVATTERVVNSVERTTEAPASNVVSVLPTFEAATLFAPPTALPAVDPVPAFSAPTRGKAVASEATAPRWRAEQAQTPEVPNWDTSVPAQNTPAASVAAPRVTAPIALPAAEVREERHVTVTIGRLEVKVVPPAAGAKPPAPAPPPQSDLAEYLRRRGGGDR